MARLMKSDYNKYKSMLERDAEASDRFVPLEKMVLMNEVKEARDVEGSFLGWTGCFD